jgi:hypothetical protein
MGRAAKCIVCHFSLRSLDAPTLTGPKLTSREFRQSYGTLAFTRRAHAALMEMIPSSLLGAAAAARDRVAELAREGARAAASGTPGAPLRAAAVAREAIFADALEAALHARLEELKSVAK